MIRVLALLLLTALPAAAECVTPASLAKGVSFTREDGITGLIAAEGKLFHVDYEQGDEAEHMDIRKSKLGIYDIEVFWDPPFGPMVDDGPSGRYAFQFAQQPPLPHADNTWKTTVTRLGDSYPGLLAISRRDRVSYRVSYNYLAESTATLSGCTYRILPVEATFINADTDLTRRFIYFPDLGFGLETRVVDRKGDTSREVGLIALTPKG